MYLQYPTKRASFGNVIPVQRLAHTHEHDSKQNSHRAHSERPLPALICADPHKEGDSNYGSTGEAEQEPVEETRQLGLLPRVPLIELVSSEWREGRLDPACPERHEVQAREEHGHLAAIGFLAFAHQIRGDSFAGSGP